MLAGIFVLVIAAAAIAAGVGYIRTAKRMRGFATTRGRITGREVYDDINFSNVEPKYGAGGGYTPKFTYTYTVDGKTFTGDKLAYTTRGYKKSIVEQKVAAMPDEVDVHYNPQDPSEAYLQLEPNTRTGWLLIALGDFLTLIALILILGS